MHKTDDARSLQTIVSRFPTIKAIGAVLALLVALPSAYAVNQKKSSRTATQGNTGSTQLVPSRAMLPVQTTTIAGPGQEGYVHYFLITHPDGTLEHQVGIELEDQRIAWSFPGTGVSVHSFVTSGSLKASGKKFGIRHLFGIRPFPDSAAMQALRKELTARAALWVDDGVQYCIFRTPGEPFCQSCGDFVLHMLFPGSTPLTPALPRDFIGTGSNNGLTADDLMLYLLGVYNINGKAARLKRLNQLGLPDVLREEATLLVETANYTDDAPKQVASKPAVQARSSATRTTRPSGKLVERKAARKKL